MYKTILASAFCVGLAGTPALADEVKAQRTISLSGHGEVTAMPDMATITSGVVSQAATAADAVAANSRAMSAVLQALADAGIAAEDIQTSNFTVQPRYDYSDNAQQPKLAGYDVSNNVTVAVRNLDRLGALLDTMVKSGANQMSGIAFQVSKPDAALDEARKRALEDAARKARLYAGAMAVGLGPVVSISEGAADEPPVPVRAKAMAAESLPVPIAAGQQTLSVDVNVIWEIR